MPSEGPAGRRTFLFLQGPASPLFARIAQCLEAAGHRALRVNFCAGDWLFWRRRGARNYRGTLAAWPAAIADLLDREAVDAVVLLGEERPLHRIAAAAAARRGIPVCAVEMGYLRPDWVTIERGGAGSNSHFPNDPAAILAAAAGLPQPDFAPRYGYGFLLDAANDLAFNLPNVFLWPLFPHYRWHALFHPLAEYSGWLRRLARGRSRARHAAAQMAALEAAGGALFLLPLQLETDYQLRAHSPFDSQRDVIGHVVASFARHAPPDAVLVVKLHPLDNGLIDWAAILRREAERAGIPARVRFLDGGDLDRLLVLARGVVSVNSTVGLQALRRGVPVKLLGVAIYDVAGLTDARPLDDFWSRPSPPDPKLCDAFVRLMAATIQVRGDLHSKEGVKAAAQAIAQRLIENRVNEPGGYAETPPRPRPAKKDG